MHIILVIEWLKKKMISFKKLTEILNQFPKDSFICAYADDFSDETGLSILASDKEEQLGEISFGYNDIHIVRDFKRKMEYIK